MVRRLFFLFPGDITRGQDFSNNTKCSHKNSYSHDVVPGTQDNNTANRKGGGNMESLHTRLDHQKDKVLRGTSLFGRFHAMDEFGVKDYERFSKWLKEVTGDENFGINPKLGSDGGKGIAGQVAIKVVHTLLDLQAENKELRRELTALKGLHSRDNGSDTDAVLALMEVCQV